MATYVIGDVHGCHRELCRLLDLIGFSKKHDRLWLTGDLVNRGPDSVRVVREIMALGDAAQSVLGNHEFHLFVTAAGHHGMGPKDRFSELFSAKDRDALFHWLRHRPLAFYAEGCLVVHAGVVPSWTVEDTLRYAAEVEAFLRSDDAQQLDHFLETIYGNTPVRWQQGLRGASRWRTIVNVCTRLQCCTADDEIHFSDKHSAMPIPPGMQPWFAHGNRRTRDVTVISGHWAARGLALLPNVLMMDSDCLWGGVLSAVRLEDRQVFQVPSETR